jgi:subtilase family serine protease
MSQSGSPIQATNPSDPLQIKEHHPAHIKKFIGQFFSPLVVNAPATILTAYGSDILSCSHSTTSDWTDPKLCGHGQTIAIVDAYDDPNIANDLVTFDNQFGLPACTDTNGCLVKYAPTGIITDSGWALEISLDVEWAHSIAPGAKIVLVESSDNSLGSLLSAVDAAVGAGAQQVSNSWGGGEFSTESSYDYHYNSATASFFVSSGDSGHGVIWPAASPYVISVGGTTLVTDSSGNWVSETAWSGSGGGNSRYEPKPSYQNNFNTNIHRSVPDVSYNADPNTGVYVYDSVPINGNSGWWQVGGTSAGAPQWAGISAIANSQNAKLASKSFGTSIALYGAATGKAYLTNYHDITSGSNGNCGFVCNARPGYDKVTGVGSPRANNLIPYLSPSSIPDFAISSSPSSLTINSGSSGLSTITVTPLYGFTGTVSLTSPPSTPGTSYNPTSLAGGGTSQLTITVPPNTAAGTYQVTVTGTSGSLIHSTAVTVTVLVAPSSPQNLVATAGNAQVILTWSAPLSNGGSSITNYNVYRGTSSGTETLLATVGNVNSYTDTGLTNGVPYFYKVTAVNSVGESPQSNEASATPVVPTSGIVLDNIQSTSGTTSSTNQITLASFNAGAGSNQLLLVGTSANNNNVASVTFGGIPLTQAVSSFYNNDAEFWYLKNPSGTGDIVITMNGPTQAVVGAYSISGVDQTNPIPTHVTRHNTTPNSPNISITTKYPNDWVFDLPSIYGGSTLGTPTCTQQWNLNVPGAITGASSSTMVPSPAFVTCSWTASSGDLWDEVAVEIKVTG